MRKGENFESREFKPYRLGEGHNRDMLRKRRIEKFNVDFILV